MTRHRSAQVNTVGSNLSALAICKHVQIFLERADFNNRTVSVFVVWQTEEDIFLNTGIFLHDELVLLAPNNMYTALINSVRGRESVGF